MALVSAPILKAPDWNTPFHVHIDASNFAIGCILAEPGKHNMDFPISYASEHLNKAENNYITTKHKCEGLAKARQYVSFSLWTRSFLASDNPPTWD